MALKDSTIHSKLTACFAAFIVVLLATSALAVGALLTVDYRATELRTRWMGGTRLLGELGDQLTEFRLDEAYLVHERDETVRLGLLESARRHADTIDAQIAEYSGIADPVAQIALTLFERKWRAFYAAHGSWAGRDPDNAAPDAFATPLGSLYTEADAAANAVIAANAEAATRDSHTISTLTRYSVACVAMMSVGALLLVTAMFILVRRNITNPLREMTAALNRLARGERDFEMIGTGRTDEIGDMAAAFNAFLETTRALDRAHEATRIAQSEARQLARSDALTGLPNRSELVAALDTEISRTPKATLAVLVTVVNVRRLKRINELYGHAVGDRVLCEITSRFNQMVGWNDIVARLAGDEFALVTRVRADTRAAVASRFAQRLLDELSRPIAYDGAALEIGASIGMAACPDDGDDAERLLRAADIAMHRAKRDTDHGYRLFEPAMDDALRAQATLEADLRFALMSDMIHPHYQPLIDLRTNHVYGFEILARWTDAERGPVSPDVFVPVAERLGIVAELTYSMLGQACRDAVHWPASTRLSLNVSARMLTDQGLVDALCRVLARAEFDRRRLEIEVTETALLADIGGAKAVIAEFQRRGMRVSLDDFGTGFSSLSHLRELKVDKVKIDKSFVMSMHTSAESEKIVTAILGLAANLEIPTVAEGIEDAETARFLARHGCEFGQGFLYGRAMNPADASRFLLAYGPRTTATA
ncbi:MAG TPA: EAL domain-containing protein [Pararobbsia sp.]|nr:EAL domain-containing protein [Pararobbsia sp.]